LNGIRFLREICKFLLKIQSHNLEQQDFVQPQKLYVKYDAKATRKGRHKKQKHTGKLKVFEQKGESSQVETH